jgi:hypothetical protein
MGGRKAGRKQGKEGGKEHEESSETRQGDNNKMEESKKGKGRTHGRVKRGCIVQVCLSFWQALED